jgi:hypothetical protein
MTTFYVHTHTHTHTHTHNKNAAPMLVIYTSSNLIRYEKILQFFFYVHE